MQTQSTINGIHLPALEQLASAVASDPQQRRAGFRVATSWLGGTRSESRVSGFTLGERSIAREFRVRSDEPLELCGSNTAPNPQELLMAALNACMLVGYVAGCAMQGIELQRVEITTEGELDLRGFFGLDPQVKPGYERLRYTVRIQGDGTPEQFRQVHAMVLATSPNRWNLSQPVALDAELVVVA
ncbi:MAG: OsmC family peroxiredoxin [Planctomycetota bacterium]|nr:MAG: OsmC family peroxiredoxin [Planctomycetota bacterium]